MRLAQQHIATLKPRFAADPRFAEVELDAYTGDGGSLMVSGEVATEADVDAAARIVKQSNPPCPVVFLVRVAPSTAPATRPQE